MIHLVHDTSAHAVRRRLQHALHHEVARLCAESQGTREGCEVERARERHSNEARARSRARQSRNECRLTTTETMKRPSPRSDLGLRELGGEPLDGFEHGAQLLRRAHLDQLAEHLCFAEPVSNN